MAKLTLEMRAQPGLPDKTLVAKNYIGGQWVNSETWDHRPALNPNNYLDITAIYPESTIDDVQAAYHAAHKAFPKWRDTPAPQRAEVISNWHDTFNQYFEEGAKIISRVTGKHLTAARGEHQEALETLTYFAAQGRQAHGLVYHSEMDNTISMDVQSPKGVCAIVTAGNFPSAVPMWNLAPALVSGNTVVFKPAPETALVSYLLVQSAIDAGVPPGVINLVHGGGKGAAGEHVINQGIVPVPFNRSDINFNRYAQMMSFTGSNVVGRNIAKTAGPYMDLIMELGGNNPFYVHKDADLDLAVEAAIGSAFEDGGQRCTSAHNIIIHNVAFYPFMRKFLEAVDKVKVGNTYNHDVDEVKYGPMMNSRFAEAFMAHYDIAEKDGATLFRPGDAGNRGMITQPQENFVGNPTSGLYATPTVWNLGKKYDANIVHTEVFGPTVNLLQVSDENEAIRVATRSAYGLSSAIITQDIGLGKRWVEEVETGIHYVNGRTVGAEAHLPFGAIKDGKGKESSQRVMESYTNRKSATFNLSGRVQEAQVDAEEDRPKKSDDPIDLSKLIG